MLHPTSIENSSALSYSVDCKTSVLLNKSISKRLPLILVLTYSFLSIALSYLLYSNIGIKLLPFAVSFVILIGIGCFIYYISKHLATASIKNEMLIVTFSSRPSIVAELRCIKRIKTKRKFGFTYTILQFKFDGKCYFAYLPGKAAIEMDADKFVRTFRKSA